MLQRARTELLTALAVMLTATAVLRAAEPYRWTYANGSTIAGDVVSIVDNNVNIRTAEGKMQAVAFDELADADKRRALDTVNDAAPDVSPDWIPGYRVRVLVRVIDDLLDPKRETIIARIPSGGWLKKDVSDLKVRSASGKDIPVVILSHDALGDTLIQFRRSARDRWYWVYASNPQAPDRDLAWENRVKGAKEAAQTAVLNQMALAKVSAEKAAALRDITAQIGREQGTLDSANKELAAWAVEKPKRLATQTKTTQAVPPLKAAADKAAADLAPFAKDAADKTAVATTMTRDATAARNVANTALAAQKAIEKQIADANAQIAANDKTIAGSTQQLPGLRTAASAADQAYKAADAKAKQSQQAADAAQKAASDAQARASRVDAKDARAKADADRDVAAKEKAARDAKAEADRDVAAANQAKANLDAANKAVTDMEARLAAANKARADAVALTQSLTPKLNDAKAAFAAADAAAVAKETPAKAASEVAQAARLAAAPYETAKKNADAALATATAAKNKADAAVNEANARIAAATKIKNTQTALLAKLNTQLPPIKNAADSSKTAADNAVADAQNKDKAYFDLAASQDPRLFKEGLTVEFREWAGDELSSWPAVVGGLMQSENVIGGAAVNLIYQNANPFRRSDPRNFAASYRGFIKIDTPGVYSFFLNGDDAAFLFINGYRVYSRAGTNAPIRHRVGLYDIGADIQLTQGVHPFEVHHIVGNTPGAQGVVGMTWLTPGSKQWQYVPTDALPQAMLAMPVSIEAWDGKPVATFEFGIDDTLTADGIDLYLAQFQASGKGVENAKLEWDFADGTTGSGATQSHIFFDPGDKIVALKSHPAMPPFKRRCHVWTPPTPTSPVALRRAVEILKGTDVAKLPLDKLNDIFAFLAISQQDARWPVVEAVSKALLAKKDLDIKYRAIIYTQYMRAVADQGRGVEALKLLDEALAEVGSIDTLRALVITEAANVNRDYLREFARADEQYAGVIRDNRRLRHPLIRTAAINWGDMFLDAGKMPEAAQAYRLARDLGTVGLAPDDDPAKRGALLRVAEQQLKGGNIRQTRRLLSKIEDEFPEQKLEGLYRFLRGEAERNAGNYEVAIRNYEVLLNLPQWAGYRANAIFGIADSYYRIGNLDEAGRWLVALKESFPDTYEARQLASYQATIDNRRKQISDKASEGTDAIDLFDRVDVTFEPADQQAMDFAQVRIGPSTGIAGQQTVMLETNVRTDAGLPGITLKNLPTQGSLWVEFWTRDNLGIVGQGNHRFVDVYIYNDQKQVIAQQRVYFERSFGQWQKTGLSLGLPKTLDGSVYLVIHGSAGVFEVDGVRISHVSDRDESALRNFLEGADPQ